MRGALCPSALPSRVLALALLAAVLVGCGRETQAPPPPPPPAPLLPCDRACLEGIAGQYLEAVVAHDPQRVPVLPDFRFTENGARLDAGDGLWRTMTGLGSYRLVVPDEERGRVALLVSVREAGLPAMLAAQLTVRQRKLSGAETLVLRDEAATRGFETLGPPAAPDLDAGARLPRAALVQLADGYFSGLQRNDGQGDYRFAPDCQRVENGARVTGRAGPAGAARPDPATATAWSPQWGCEEQFRSGLLYYVSRVRDRRIAAVDPRRGLVFAFAVLDHSAGEMRRFRSASGTVVEAGPRQPESWLTANVMRADAAGIHSVTTAALRVPYGLNGGWSDWEQGLSSTLRDAPAAAPAAVSAPGAPVAAGAAR